MFAVRKTFTLRALLIAAILFNTLVPTLVSAKSSSTNDVVVSPERKITGKSDEIAPSSLRVNHNQQRFVPSTDGVSEKAQPSLQSGDGWLVCDSVRRETTNAIAGYCDPAHSQGTYIRGVITLNKILGLPVGRYMAFHNTAPIPSNKINFRYVLSGVGKYESNFTANFFGHYEFTSSHSNNMYDYWNVLGTGNTIPYEAKRTYLNHTIQGQFLQDFWVNFRFHPDYPTDYSSVYGYFEAWIGDYPISEIDPNSVLFSGCGSGSCINPTQGSAGDPINTRTGTFSMAFSDLSIPTSAGELIFQRSYSSGATSLYNLPLGYGWTHNHDAKLILPSDPEGTVGFVIFQDVNGNQYKFKIEPDDSYSPTPGVIASLTKSTTEYILITPLQSTFRFDLTGRLHSQSNAQGRAFTYDYDSQDRLYKISADEGDRFIQIHYDDSHGRIDLVSDHTGRQVSYDYNSAGDLISFVDVLDQTWTYTYSAHRMTRIHDQEGVQKVRTEYDAQGRAWRQYIDDADGDGQEDLLVTLTYNAGTTTITDANGNSHTHFYDAAGTLRDDSNQFGGNTNKIYDNNLRPKSIIDPDIVDPNKRTTTLDWSDDGANLEYIKDASGGETFIKYEAPNSPNNPSEIKDPLGNKTQYTYGDTNFPNLPTKIETLDANGTLVSRVTYEYHLPSSGIFAGKIKSITDILGQKTSYEYESTPTGYEETITKRNANDTLIEQIAINEYDDLWRPIVVTSRGLIVQNEYDDAGHLIKTTRNPHPTNTQQNYEDKYNLITTYAYDVRGNQIAVTDTYDMITRTYYDLANRPVTVVKNLIGQAIEVDSPPQRNTSISDQNIRTDTVYADNGDVIATIDAQGIITRMYYNYADRTQTTVTNLVGRAIADVAPLPYDPAHPDQNIYTTTVFDANGNAIASIDTLGVITRTYYDELNRPITAVQNLTGQAISVATPPSRGTSSNIRTDTHYDKNGNVIATVDPNEVTTRTYYDALNRPVTVVKNLTGQAITDPNTPLAGMESNIRSDTRYDLAGNVIATIDPRGVITRTYYDEANRPVTTVQNLVEQDISVNTPPARGSGDQNVRTDIAYDQNGRRDTTTDPLDRDTKYEYDEVGQLLSVTANYTNGGVPQNDQDQRNIVTEYTYDALGRQIKVTDTAGRITMHDYDPLGRLASVTRNYMQGQPQNYKDASGDQYNLITAYTYDVRGSQIAVTDTAGIITRTYYDALARPVSVVRNLLGQGISVLTPPELGDPPSSTANVRTDTVYLGDGSIDYVVDQMGQITDYEYDSAGRLTSLVDPLSNPTNFAYDANGNRTQLTTFKTTTEPTSTKFEYDALNYLKTVIENYRPGIDPDVETNVTTSYTYDAAGNRLSIRDGNSNLEEILYETAFTYDPFGRLKTETDPLGHAISYYYDAIGNLTRQTDALNQRTCFYYDELNRLTGKHYRTDDNCPANPTFDVTFDYDALGRRDSMTDSLGTTDWAYNNLDLPISITDPFGTSVSYDYDAVGNRTNVDYAGQSTVYGYNALNQLDEVISSRLPDKVEYGYDAAGRLKTVTRPNGVDTTYHYFDNGWLQDVIHTSGSSTLASYQYQYYQNGNRKQAIENILFPSLPPTVTPSPTVTIPPTATATASLTFTPTSTLTPESIFTPTFTETITPSPTETASPTFDPAATNTPTITPSSTATATPTSQPSNALYLSLGTGEMVGGIDASDLDILYFDGANWSMYFQASDVGIGEGGTDQDVNDFQIVDSDTILLTFEDPLTIGSLAIDSWDIVQFDATSLGETTAGTFSTYFDGSDVGLDDTANEIIDALDILSDGRILISTKGDFSVPGLTGKDEDLLVFTPTALGETTSGSWAMYFDGSISALGLGNSAEDLDALEIAASGSIYLSTADAFAVTGVSGEDEDVFVCTPTYTGNAVTSCTYSSTLFFDGSAYGLSTNDVDAVNLPLEFASGNSHLALINPAGRNVSSQDPAEANGHFASYQLAPPHQGESQTFNPVADSYVNAELPANNYGTSTILRTDGSPDIHSYLRFDVQGITGPIASATLHVYANSALSAGYRAHSVSDNTWTESAVNYNNAPAVGGVLGSSGAVAANTWTTIDVTSYITGNGVYNLALTTTSSTNLSLASREATNKPQLVITLAGTPTPTYTSTETSTPNVTATQTPAVSDTPTFTATPTQTAIPSLPVTIDYVYDPLNRLTSATYSNGPGFGYDYDAVGNVMEYAQTQGGSTIVTTYHYDFANQLETAQSDNSSIVWEYIYNANGSLTGILPDGNAANGGRRYTYNTAGYLIKAESHDGNQYQLQAEMLHDGLGQRLSMTGYAFGTSVTTQYLLDPSQNSRPLAATSGGNTTHYLYGIDPIAEFTTSWSYSLPDGTNTPRQLTNTSGEITLSGSYTPWGNSLEYSGTGSFTFGYFGGLMDATTGLLYVGNGQYYDPATGRFLSRDVQPGKSNPYVPWGNPATALIAPLALVGLIYSRKRKKSGMDHIVIVLFISLGVGIGLSACGPTPTSTPPQPTAIPSEVPPTIPPVIPTPTSNAGDCRNPYRSDGSFDYEAFEACRFKGTSFSGSYIKRGGDQATFLHLELNQPCLETGPTSREDACIYFQNRANVVGVVIHHTGGPVSSLENLLPTYLDPSSVYDKVDYAFHFLIKSTGEVYEGRPMLIRGSHAPGGNFGSIGIELEGNFNVDTPGDTQIDVTINLINAIKAEGVNLKFFTAHRDVDPITDCPGDLFYGSSAFERIYRETQLAYVPNPSDWGLVYPWR